MRWADLDLAADQPLWTIPAATRKGRLGRERTHLLPLPPLAASVLKDIQQVTGHRERVFHKISYNAREFWTHPVSSAPTCRPPLQRSHGAPCANRRRFVHHGLKS